MKYNCFVLKYIVGIPSVFSSSPVEELQPLETGHTHEEEDPVQDWHGDDGEDGGDEGGEADGQGDQDGGHALLADAKELGLLACKGFGKNISN